MLTRRLLLGFGELHAPPLVHVGALAILACLLPAAALIDFVIAARRRERLRRALRESTAVCSGGHVTALRDDAALLCPSCGSVFERHPYSPCEACGEFAAIALKCPCGRQLRHPLVDLDGELR